MMNRLTNRFRLALVLVLSLLSLQSGLMTVGVEHAQAADCASPGAAAQLGVYTTDRSDFKRPDVSLDPQALLVGQQSVRMEVEIEDAYGCAVPAPAATQIALIITDTDGDLLSTGGANQNQAYNFTISSGNTRQGFFVKARKIATATITAATRPTSAVSLASGTVSASFVAPSPVAAKVHFIDVSHGLGDSISGLPGAVATSAQVPGGITVRVYALTTDTVPLDFIAANADGSFGSLSTGDDKYRQVYVRAEYPGGDLSPSATVVDQPYPSLVTNLKVLHGSTDGAQISWTATEANASFRVYRKLADDLAVFSESHFLTATSSTSYLDTTAIIGTNYKYAVKQVNVAGSYTPEFAPTALFRFDIANAQLVNTLASAPSVTFVTSSDLADHQDVIKATFTNTTSGEVYTGTIARGVGTTFKAGSQYMDAALAAHSTLPDAVYAITIYAVNTTLGFNDFVTVGTSYVIDTIAPNTPVLGKHRYIDNTLTGIAGAVESGVLVDVYGANPANQTIVPLVIVLSDGSGAFSAGSQPVPADGKFYIVARDTAGNKSAAMPFDVINKPATPRADLISIQQNNPGNNDVVTGAPGAVTPGITMRIYTADPSVTPNLVPIREFIAHVDGSFSQEVGDNASTEFWLASWSGANILSDAISLRNATAIGTPASFSVTPGDGSAVLKWSAVSGVSYYAITVYDVTTMQNVQIGTVAGTQTELVVNNLVNGHVYRFYVNARDVYGNLGLAVEKEVIPRVRVVAQASVA